MNKTAAIRAVKNGFAVSHSLFAPGEYVKLFGKQLIDERGNKMDFNNYWKDRQFDVFQRGWRYHTTERK